MVPQKLPVGYFVQDGHPHTAFVRGHFFRHNVHGHLTQVQVGADPGGGGNAGFPEDLPDQHAGKARAVHTVGA